MSASMSQPSPSTAKPTNEPKRIRLTEDFIDLKVGMAYPKGTVLIRSQHGTGQYMLEGTRLGQPCVAGLFLLKGIFEVLV